MLTAPNKCLKCQSSRIHWDNEVQDFYCNDCKDFLDFETGCEYDADAVGVSLSLENRERVYAAIEHELWEDNGLNSLR